MTSPAPRTPFPLSASPSDALRILTQFSQDMASTTNLSALGEYIVLGLSQALSVSRASLFTFDREREMFCRLSSLGPQPQGVGYDKLPASHPLPLQLSSTRRILRRAEWADCPADGPAVGMRNTLEALQAETCVPFVTKGRLIGFAALGKPGIGEKDDAAALALLTALGQSAANALDNALLYEDLHRSQTLMRRTDRLRSLEIIAGGFAHEIRNPLTSIKTFIQLAPERKDDPEFIREFSKVVLDDVYRIERLIQEILDYARYMEPKLTEEDLNEIVSSCVYFIEVKADSRGIKIEKDLAPDLPRVMLDRQQIKQVLLNLLLNAMDAIGGSGGRLRVRTHKLMKPGGKVWSQIEIEDTGQGISETNLEHIFDPFFTTKHESGEHEGTGLGLTIAHQIIQEHHGEIQVKSTEGIGTTFYVNLPALP